MIPAAKAGTYSLIDVEWVVPGSPGSGTGGGYINFGTGSDANSVLYGIVASLTAATRAGNSASAFPTVSGYFRWKIQWVGAVGEAVPTGDTGVTQITGSSTVSVQAALTSGTTDGDAQGSLTDPYFLTSLQHANTSISNPDLPTPATVNGPFYDTVGLGTLTLVSGTTYVGYANSYVNSAATLIDSGYGVVMGPIFALSSYGTTSINMNAKIKLLSMGGQSL